MRIVIDMQGAQSTGSRNRGIGRYTQAIAKACAIAESTRSFWRSDGASLFRTTRRAAGESESARATNSCCIGICSEELQQEGGA